MLSVWPDMAKPNEVRLRKSLIKFESSLVDLNVVRVSLFCVSADGSSPSIKSPS